MYPQMAVSMLQHFVKTILAHQVYSVRGADILRHQCGILILMYHEVTPRNNPVFRHFGVLGTTPETFKQQVDWLSQHFEIISMDEAVRRLQDGSAGESRAVAITSDDGWMGFHQHAVPFLHGRKLSATVYVATGILEGHLPWYVRWRLLLRGNRHILESLAHELGRFEPFPSVEEAMHALRGLDIVRIEHLWKKVVEQFSVDVSKLPQGWFIGEGEVHEMVENGITVGAHTVSHPMLTHELEQSARWEIAECRRRLQEVCGGEVVHFAYPAGDYNDRVVDLVREAGYSSAVTTDYGWNADEANLHRLRRIDVHETACTDHRGRFDEAIFALWVTGEWERIRRRLKFLQ